MELQAEIGADDARALRRHLEALAERNRRRPSFAVLTAAWGVIAVLFTWLYTATTLPPGYILSCGIGIALGFFLAAWVVQQREAPAAEATASPGQRLYALDGDGLRVCTATWELTLQRRAIHSIEETQEHFFLHTATGAVLIVPKRAFASPDEEREFREGLREKD